MDKKEQKLRVLGLLEAGLNPQDISDAEGVPYSTIMSWKKKFSEEKDEVVISDIAKASVQTLIEIKDELQTSSPVIAAEVEDLINGVIGLKELEPAFHSVLMRAISRADKYLQEENISIKDWQMVVRTISDAYAAIFNKSGTIVNVANTQVSGSEAVAFFKASKKN